MMWDTLCLTQLCGVVGFRRPSLRSLTCVQRKSGKAVSPVDDHSPRPPLERQLEHELLGESAASKASCGSSYGPRKKSSSDSGSRRHPAGSTAGFHNYEARLYMCERTFMIKSNYV